MEEINGVFNEWYFDLFRVSRFSLFIVNIYPNTIQNISFDLIIGTQGLFFFLLSNSNEN